MGDTLTEEVWGNVITGNARTVLINEVGALEHLVLQRRVPQGQTQRTVDGHQVYVLELDARTGMDVRAVQRGSNVVPTCPVEVDPAYVFDRHLGRVATMSALPGVYALRDLYR